MLNRHIPFFAALLLFGMCAAAMAAPTTRAEPLPRYKLAVGQKIVYTCSYSEQFGRGTKQVVQGGSTSVYRVASRTKDGAGWQLVGEISKYAKQNGGVDQYAGSTPTLVMFDLWPDGRMKMEALPWVYDDQSAVFPRLPADAGASAWDQPLDRGGTVYYRRAMASDAERFSFSSEEDSLWHKIYVSKSTRAMQFDLSRGLLLHATRHMTMDYHSPDVLEETTELTAVSDEDAEQARKYAQEAQSVVVAIRQYRKAIDEAQAGPVEPKLEDALKELERAQKTVSQPTLRAQIDDRIKQHPARWEEARKWATIVGKPAPQWELADLDGNRHALKDLRGKVVVLDFWYRGCGWCMWAMPQLMRVSEELRDQPVAFFGMSVDEDAKDAQWVAQTFKLPYPTLRARSGPSSGPPPASGGGVADAYHIDVYPTLIVIGPDEVVRHVHVGYNQSLHDDLKKVIEDLLRR